MQPTTRNATQQEAQAFMRALRDAVLAVCREHQARLSKCGEGIHEHIDSLTKCQIDLDFYLYGRPVDEHEDLNSQTDLTKHPPAVKGQS